MIEVVQEYTITVTHRMRGADWSATLQPQTVTANDLVEALAKAREIPFANWFFTADGREALQLHTDDGPVLPNGGLELVMPFVVCASQGGPYDDSAFVAGYTAGLVDASLTTAAPAPRYVPSTLVPQVDLLAMRYGWQMTSEPWEEHPDEWTLVSFRRVPVS